MYLAKTKSGSAIEVKGWWRRKLFIYGYPQTQASYRRDWKTILRRSGVNDLPHRGSALVLGLGGGDVIKLLIYQQANLAITAVELESKVVEVAKKYFGIAENSKLKIVVADAGKHMRANVTKYDLIIVDLYSGDDVPSFVTTKKFLQNIAKSLYPKGKAIFNYASHSFKQKDFEVFERELREHFGQVTQLKTWGHTYFLASNV